ncbi:Demethylrebeccamycin-D-glucose O-methyltransferase [Aquisphaera giovannonii]|uniref:Demethylrebeccamycin-D-glucose O-methyltransferase n=1 Tax=Aquisphaera giovannonii TaxID=406548 RepID=A0A5B9VYN6_9BACT|nr:methyltransferase domain-containing protein [Aquisphaera giovannonii]QEH33094.1 Demethylrebeccamycin-D-glucose O-methyltransferase [Aquisphaera giovannonii]
MDVRLASSRFPRSSAYHPDWVLKNAATGSSNPLWLAEWLAEAMELRPGMRVLDLGCGRAITSIFLAREFSVQVWATDLWFPASGNARRIRDAGLEDRVFPIHADARSLPFAGEFFDAIVSVDSYYYYGTDDLYLNYLAHFVKPAGQIGIAGAGLVGELDGTLPEHLAGFWTNDLWSLHSAAWWRRHWERSGIVSVEVADALDDGWRRWLEWQRIVAPDNGPEIEAVEADAGRTLAHVRAVGRRKADAVFQDYCWPDTLRSVPDSYEPEPLLRESGIDPR